MYYYKRRFYNPEIGRFISADPLYAEEMDERATDTQELNLYVYVRNNPMKYVDPSGEFNQHFMGMMSYFGVSNQVHSEAKAITKAYGTTAAVATGAGVAVVGGAAMIVAAPAAAKATVGTVVGAQMQFEVSAAGIYVYSNPEGARDAVGGAISFVQGLVSGVTGSQTPLSDPSTNIMGNPAINAGMDLLGQEIGREAAEAVSGAEDSD